MVAQARNAGAIASAILTVPAILFDGHLEWKQRLENLLLPLSCKAAGCLMAGRKVSECSAWKTWLLEVDRRWWWSTILEIGLMVCDAWNTVDDK